MRCWARGVAWARAGRPFPGFWDEQSAERRLRAFSGTPSGFADSFLLYIFTFALILPFET